MQRSKVQQILRRRREEKELEWEEIRETLDQIVRRLQRLGYQATSSDFIGRLRLSKETRWFLRELGYMTISELEESCLNGIGIFLTRRQESEFVIKVREEIAGALLEYRENRLGLLRERVAKD